MRVILTKKKKRRRRKPRFVGNVPKFERLFPQFRLTIFSECCIFAESSNLCQIHNLPHAQSVVRFEKILVKIAVLFQDGERNDFVYIRRWSRTELAQTMIDLDKVSFHIFHVFSLPFANDIPRSWSFPKLHLYAFVELNPLILWDFS